MTIENITSVSLIGNLSSYYGGEFRSTSINIKELLSGQTSFRDEAFYEELYLKSINFKIIVHDEDEEGNDEFEEAGELIGRIFDVERCDEDKFDPMEVYDNVDQYTYEIYQMGRKNHEGIISENIFAIDNFVIHPEYREKNVGTAVMHMLAEVLDAQFNSKVGCFIVVPEPKYDNEREAKPDETQYEIYRTKCVRFWEKLGFKCLEGSSYWYFNLDMRMLVNGQDPVEEEKECLPQPEVESAKIYEFRPRTDYNE